MKRYVIPLFVLGLLALVACASPTQLPQPQATSKQTSVPVAPTLVLATPDWSRLLSEQFTLTDPQHADQSMRELTDWAREASGLRDQLGAQADDIFRQADAVGSLAVQDMLRQMRSGAKPKGRPTPLRPPVHESVPIPQFAAMTSLMSILPSAPDLFQSHSVGDPKESEQKVGDNATAQIKMTPRVTGAQVELDVELTLRIEKDGQVYEEKANGKISITVCPDKEGNVILDLAMQSRAGAGNVGYTTQFADHAIGHVDDEGNLASVDREIEADMSLPRGKNWLTGALEYSSSTIRLRYAVTGMTSKDPKQWSITGMTGDVQKTGSESLDKAAISVAAVAVFVETQAFRNAEEIWQNGYCIALSVPQGVEQRVMKWSDTLFTVLVRHKIEGQDLNVPVIATLTDGMLSVTPSDTKVPAPATFTYRAPNGAGQEATVELVSRSRRGIGKLTIGFKIDELFYIVDQSIADGRGRLTGNVCALDKPFALDVKGVNAALGTYVGYFKFTPADKSGGGWTHQATTTCLPELGCGTLNASGTYQAEELADGRARISMNPTTQVTSFGGSVAMPPWQFELDPSTGVCAPD